MRDGAFKCDEIDSGARFGGNSLDPEAFIEHMQRCETGPLSIEPNFLGCRKLVPIGRPHAFAAMLLNFPQKSVPAFRVHQVPGVKVEQATGDKHSTELVEIEEEILLVEMTKDQVAISAVEAGICEGQYCMIEFVKVRVMQMCDPVAPDLKQRRGNICPMPLTDHRRQLASDARHAAAQLKYPLLPIKDERMTEPRGHFRSRLLQRRLVRSVVHHRKGPPGIFADSFPRSLIPFVFPRCFCTEDAPCSDWVLPKPAVGKSVDQLSTESRHFPSNLFFTRRHCRGATGHCQRYATLPHFGDRGPPR